MSPLVKAALFGAGVVFVADKFKSQVASQASLPAFVRDNAGVVVGALAGIIAHKVM